MFQRKSDAHFNLNGLELVGNKCGNCVLLFLHRGLQKEEVVLLTHGDSVDKVADGFKVVAQSGNVIAGMDFLHHYT